MLRKALYPAAIVFAASLALTAASMGAVSGQAQARRMQATIIQSASDVVPVKARFNLGETFGSRHRIELRITEPGRIRMRAEWIGSAGRLAFILNGPGQEGGLARTDGVSPLEIDFAVTDAMVSQGDQWTVSIVNFGGSGYARGLIAGEHPAHAERVDITSSISRQAWRLSDDHAIVTATPATPPAPTGEPRRTVLADGTIEIQYPDGTIQRFPPGCGFEIIRPDGTAMRALCNEVQGMELPDLPSDLSDDELNGWLNGLADRLMNTITIIVNDEAALQNFINIEEGMALLERIDLRSEAIKHLMAPAPPG